MSLRLTRFDQMGPMVRPATGLLTQEAQRRLQRMMEQIEGAVNTLATTLDNIIELNDLVTSVEAAALQAQEAAAEAAAAAATATEQAVAAQASATTANQAIVTIEETVQDHETRLEALEP